jgi:hypothetical protein
LLWSKRTSSGMSTIHIFRQQFSLPSVVSDCSDHHITNQIRSLVPKKKQKTIRYRPDRSVERVCLGAFPSDRCFAESLDRCLESSSFIFSRTDRASPTLATRHREVFVWRGAYSSIAIEQTWGDFCLVSSVAWRTSAVSSVPRPAYGLPRHIAHDSSSSPRPTAAAPALCFAVIYLPRHSFGELSSFSFFFLNCVHIAYFSTSFGSHSHSLSTNIL